MTVAIGVRRNLISREEGGGACSPFFVAGNKIQADISKGNNLMGEGLEGIRVLELGGGVSAPVVGKLMGDLGAEVVKIEPPQGEPARRRGPFLSPAPGHHRWLLLW